MNTEKDSEQVLQSCLQIEVDLGRKKRKTQGYVARIIDIDVLFVNDEVIETESLFTTSKTAFAKVYIATIS